MSDSRLSDEEIFAAALERPAAERATFLDGACFNDAMLRQRIEGLLSAHLQATSFMEKSPAAPIEPDTNGAGPSVEALAGDHIGRYKLLQKIGEGGCGVVYMAEQEEPVRRRVALKVIKLGMDTREVIVRFEAERQALALMDHPNIARVFDAGATDTGRPFFVMELVRGVPITKYCDEQKLPTSARLESFVQVCHAVQHAHQKGIIHRDIKPSNVLVTLHDGVAVPKVIDFGIAKATAGRLTDHTLFTAFNQFIGTPAYMSPEQAEFSGLDIDTRSDIYSLGVLLYELLSGRLPFDPKSLLGAGLDEIRRIIRDIDPPRPSTRLSTLTDADRATIAELRATAPAQLSTLLRGDLDWIVMRCLEKDRTRRYETANDLALDVRRHLHDEPVAARPPSAAYRLQKLVRRNKLVFGAATAVTIALIAGIVTSTWQAVRARQARNDAWRRQEQAEDLLGFMVSDLRVPLAKLNKLEVLDAVGEKAMAYFASLNSQDLTDTALRRQVEALRQIGENRKDQARYPEALRSLEAAYESARILAARHPKNGDLLFERAQAEFWIGYVLRRLGRLKEMTEWLTRYRDTGALLVALDPASPRWQEELAHGHHNLAVVDTDEERLEPARRGFLGELTMLTQLSAARPADLSLQFRIVDINSWLGNVAEMSGDFGEAAARFAEHVSGTEVILRAEPDNARWKGRLADALSLHSSILTITGRPAEAMERRVRATTLLESLVSGDPQNHTWLRLLLWARLKEAELLSASGDLTAAAKLCDELKEKFEKLLAAEPKDPLMEVRLSLTYRLQAELLAAQGRDGASEAAAQAVELAERLVSVRQTYTYVNAGAQAHLSAGRIAAGRGKGDAAQKHRRRALELLEPHLPGSNHWRILYPAAHAYRLLGRHEASNTLVERLQHLGFRPLEPWPDTSATTPLPQSHRP